MAFSESEERRIVLQCDGAVKVYFIARTDGLICVVFILDVLVGIIQYSVSRRL